MRERKVDEELGLFLVRCPPLPSESRILIRFLPSADFHVNKSEYYPKELTPTLAQHVAESATASVIDELRPGQNAFDEDDVEKAPKSSAGLEREVVDAKQPDEMSTIAADPRQAMAKDVGAVPAVVGATTAVAPVAVVAVDVEPVEDTVEAGRGDVDAEIEGEADDSEPEEVVALEDEDKDEPIEPEERKNGQLPIVAEPELRIVDDDRAE